MSLAFIASLRKKGIQVYPFKIGPDFLDPLYLGKVANTSCYNLDLFFSPLEHVQDLLKKDGFNLIESVMGFYDGDKQGQNSTAHLAFSLDIPVFLIVEPLKAANSLAAVVYGFCQLRQEGKLIKGIILNKYTSLRQVELLEASLEQYNLPPLVGAFPKGSLPELKSRYLGLYNQVDLSGADRQRLEEAGEKYFFWERISKVCAFKKEKVDSARIKPGKRQVKKVKLGVILDEAFNFYYQAQLEALKQRGVELVFFSSLTTKTLPSNLKGLYIGGGYPELYASLLSANKSLLEDIRKFGLEGGKIYAECGGLIFLTQGIEDQDKFYPLVGLLNTRVKLLPKKAYLGYVKVKINRDCGWFRRDTLLKGHEFHYSTLLDRNVLGVENVYEVVDSLDNPLESKGFYFKNILASYIHLYFAHQEEVLDNFYSFLKES
ncbi:MAG: cobyrinic acid a,c-diamide synthase [Desulfonauticus sp.]|nr:cobyrinic acid a,c-diamide synthase [Desulfonauticus sp.]